MSMSTRSGIRQVPDGSAESDLGRAQALSQLSFVQVERDLKRVRVERVGPHHQGILAVVAVVAAPNAHLFEGVLAVQVLRDGIRSTYFEGHPACANFDRSMDQRDK